MSEPVELYCTQDEDTGEWLVWFPHPLGGMNVLESFDNEADAMTKLAELIGEQKELNVAYAVKKVSVDKHEVLVKHDC